MDIEKLSLAKITEQEIKSVKYGELKKLAEKLGVIVEVPFGVKKAVIVKDIWRAVCAKREQIEAGMTEEEVKADNLKRKEKKEKAILDAKAQEELEKERAKNEVLQNQEKKPMTREQVENFILKIEKSLEFKKKTPGQKKNSLAKLRNLKLILENMDKED